MHGGNPSAGSGTKQRLLVVAQDINIRGSLAKLLLASGYSVELSDSGPRASEVARNGKIDLCVILCEEVSRTILNLSDELSATVPQVVVASRATSGLETSTKAGIAFIRAETAPEIAQGLQRWLKAAGQDLDPTQPQTILAFSGLRLNVAAHTLQDQTGRSIPLTHSEFLMLSAFVNSPERVLSRDQLRNMLDGRGIDVYDRSIDVLVSRLRRKIEKDPKAPAIIVTVPGVGYKLAASVKLLPLEMDQPQPVRTEVTKRVAVGVLPFTVLTSDVQIEFFAEGLVEDLIAALTYGAEIVVVSSKPSHPYQEGVANDGARDLAARFLIKGSVRATREELRILVHLVDTDDGSQVWSNRFDYPVGAHDSLETQDRLTSDIARAVKQKLCGNAAVATPEPISRRLITVLYCRLTGRDDWIAQSGLKTIKDSLIAFDRICADAAASFGGRVAARWGECVELHFGFSGLLERSAEQAVRAAIRTRDAVQRDTFLSREGLSIAVGIATGSAIFNAFGQCEGIGSAVGTPVLLAGRLCLNGQPGTISICEETRDLLRGLFEYRTTGAGVHQVLIANQVKYRLEALREGAFTRLVGRDHELRQIAAQWELARTEQGRSVLVIGEPGIGKSRLLAAFREQIQRTEHNLVHFACAPHMIDIALAPIREQVEHLAGSHPQDTVEQAELKLQSLFADMGCAKEEIVWLAAQLVHASIGEEPITPLTPEQRKEKLFSLFLGFIEKRANVSPLLVEFEDLHWSDPATLEFVALLHERLPALRMLIIMTGRPEFRPTWPDTAGGSEVRLTRLDRTQSTKLVSDIAAKALSLVKTDQIIDRAEGVPLFLEELARYVVAEQNRGGDDALGIPLTLEASLLARLDKLPTCRPIAELAAVIGRQFSHKLLSIASSQSDDFVTRKLEELTDAGIVFRTGVPPEANYGFRHALMRDAIYNGADKDARRSLHTRILLSVERKLPNMIESQPGLLAFHSFHGELFDKAAHYAFLAGRQAVRISAMREARGQLRMAREALERLPESEFRSELESEVLLLLLTALVSSEGYTSHETQVTYEQAKEVCKKTGSLAKLATVEHGIFRQYMVQADYSKALRIADDASRAGRPGWELGRGVVTMHQGDLKTALGFLQAANAKFSAAGDVENLEVIQVVGAPAYLAMCHALRGERSVAKLLMENALSLSKRIDHPTGRAFALSTTARVSWLLGGIEENRAICEELAALCRKHDFRYWLANAECYLGWHQCRDGLAQGARDRVAGALEEYRATNARWLFPFFLSIAAEVDRKEQRPLAALNLIEAALKQAADTGERWYDARLLLLKAATLAELKQASGAEQCKIEAREIMEQQGSRLFAS